MNAEKRAITAEDREKHASGLARAVVETIGMLSHDAYINLANYVVVREREARRETIEECIKVVRDNCSACGGSGIGRYEPQRYVSHDMALDAEQPEREGTLYSAEICEECEYCGRPIEAIHTLLKEDT